MSDILKIPKFGMSCLMIILSGLLLCAPTYAEESLNERSEQIEEAFVLVVKKQQQQPLEATPPFQVSDYKLPKIIINDNLLRDPQESKLFLLYQSLRLCD